MQIFEMFSSKSTEPLSVFSTDLQQAECIYSAWVEKHQPEWPAVAQATYPYQGSWLTSRPKLYAACKLDEAGVGVWDQKSAQWLVTTPDAASQGNLIRPASAMNYYRVSDGDYEMMVFAPNFERAVASYSEWYREAFGWSVEMLLIKEKSRWQLVMALAVLRDEMDAGISGIARWDADEGWHIVTPEQGSFLPDHLL